MSSISPEETNRFQIVNRDRLLVDTNMSKGGSLSSTIKNPNTYIKDQWSNDIYSYSWQMMNREHIDATSDTLYLMLIDQQQHKLGMLLFLIPIIKMHLFKLEYLLLKEITIILL